MKLAMRYKELLVGAYVANIYCFRGAFFLKLRGCRGKRFLVVEPGVRVHLSDRVFEWEVSGILGALRRHLRNRRIIDIRQHIFDRIIIFRLSGGYSLICELMPRGFLVLTRDSRIIITDRAATMKDRTISPGMEYRYPPGSPKSILDMDPNEFLERIRGSKSLWKALMLLGLGPKYALEACLRAGMSHNTPTSELREEEIKELHREVLKLARSIIDSEKGYVYFSDDEPLLFSFTPLEIARNLNVREFEDIDDALDYFFSHVKISEIAKTEVSSLLEKRAKLLRVAEEQRNVIESITKKIERLRHMVNTLYENYRAVELCLDAIRRAKDELGLSWERIRHTLKEAKERGYRAAGLVEEIMDDGTVILNVEGVRISANYRDTVNRIAQRIFEKIKRLEDKLSGARKALKETEKMISGIDAEILAREAERPIVIREPRREWFHGFRWFYTSNGLLVVAGKDAQTNETLLKKYMEPSDLVLHADIPGGAVILLKQGRDRAKDSDLMEAAIYAASYSKAWNIGFASMDVFVAKPEDISFSPPSGTYLKRGAFLVKAKRIIKNVVLELAVGLRFRLTDSEATCVILSGPRSSVSRMSDTYVVLRPGKLDKNHIVKLIREKFVAWVSKKIGRKNAEKLIRAEKIAELVPGPSEIVEDG